jgi:hypothetical protein
MCAAARKSAYAGSGVDIDAQERGLRGVKELARSTFTTGVLSELGLFGGLFRPELEGLAEPVLVASADGVGTKLAVARMAGDFSTVGRDLVNHCVNDILVQGAVPLFFLDYVGAGGLEPGKLVELVRGVAEGCRENGCALLGGETAEMPGFYQPGDYELVGFVVGLVDREALIDGARVAAGDLLLGLPSSGLHTNGYSLARKILFETMKLESASGCSRPISRIYTRCAPSWGIPDSGRWRTSPEADSPTTCPGSCRKGSPRRCDSAAGKCRIRFASCRRKATSSSRRCSGCSIWASEWSPSSIPLTCRRSRNLSPPSVSARCRSGASWRALAASSTTSA